MRFGFAAGDGLRKLAGTPATTLPRSRRIDAARAVALAPTVRRDGLDGGYWPTTGSSSTTPAWLSRWPAPPRSTAPGSSPASRHRTRRGTSITLTDILTGESAEVTARAVVNATGVWAGEVDDSIRLRPSRGTHLVFDAAAFGNPTAALTVPIPGKINRFVFAMPEQLGRVYLGLTDEDAPGPIPDVPQPTPGEISFLLDTVNTALHTALGHDDVIGAYAGLRPLIDTGAVGGLEQGTPEGQGTTGGDQHGRCLA